MNIILLATFGAMICWGIADFLIQKTIRKIGDIETLTWIGIIGSLGLLPFVIPQIHTITTQNLLLLLGSLGIINFITALINFEALKRGKLGVIDTVLELELPLTILLGIFLFKEDIPFFSFVFIGLIFIGVLLMAHHPVQSRSFKNWFEKGVLLALITAFGYGIINFLTAKGSIEIHPLVTIWMGWTIIAFLGCSYLIIHKRFHLLFRHAINSPSLILSVGIIDTLAWVFFAYALQGGELGITTAITESYPVIAIALGAYYNHERLSKTQYLGASLAILASILLALRI